MDIVVHQLCRQKLVPDMYRYIWPIVRSDILEAHKLKFKPVLKEISVSGSLYGPNLFYGDSVKRRISRIIMDSVFGEHNKIRERMIIDRMLLNKFVQGKNIRRVANIILKDKLKPFWSDEDYLITIMEDISNSYHGSLSHITEKLVCLNALILAEDDIEIQEGLIEFREEYINKEIIERDRSIKKQIEHANMIGLINEHNKKNEHFKIV